MSTRPTIRVLAQLLAALQVLPPASVWAQTQGVREPKMRVVAERIERERRAQATATPSTRLTADTAAPTSQRPVIGVAANGTPVVLIAAPNAQGVSHNRYGEFNVGAGGVVLNNSGANAPTQIAGWVQGNPFLGNNGARIILNEVSGALPSQLKGQIEVAGRAADVIIANPNGITCDGCGFINTPRATLTTGTPVYAADGVLVGLAVQRGEVAFEGQGLNARNVDRLDILARSVRANAEVWAQELNVVTGANQIGYDSSSVTANGSASGTAPRYALDVSALGGVYANSVRLIGTERGLGVNSTGGLAALTGDLELTNAGDIVLAGRTQAQRALRIEGNAVAHSGSSIAGGDASINAALITGSGTLAAGIDADGRATQAGSVRLNTSGSITLQDARLVAGADVRARGTSVTLQDGAADARHIELNGAQGVNLTGSTLTATQSATLRTQTALTTDGATVQAQTLALQANTLSNRGGTLVHSGATALVIDAADINNRGGTIATNARDLTLRATIDNRDGGQLLHAGAGTLRIDSAAVDNNSGAIGSNGDIAIDAAQVANRGGAITAQGAVRLTTPGTLDNQAGLISAQRALAVNADASLDNRGGTMQSASTTDSASVRSNGTLDNTAGQINANATLILTTGTLTNADGRFAGRELSVTSGAMSNSGANARVLADNTLTLDVQSLTQGAGGFIDGGSVALTTRGGDLSNAGAIQSRSATTVSATGINNSGLITGQSTTLDARTGALRNEAGGRIGAATTLTINAAGITNDAALMRAGTDLALDARSGAVTNTNSGSANGLVTDGVLTVRGQTVDNSGGAIDARGALTLTTPGTLDNRSGQINGRAAVDVTATTSINNGGGTIQSVSATDTVRVRTDGALDNAAGRIETNAGLTLTTGALTNTDGRIAARELAVTAGSMSSSGAAARVLADNALTLDVQSLTQASGAIIDGGSVTITARGGALSNAGAIQSAGAMTLAATGIANTGLITGQSTTLDARTGALRNEAGGRIGAATTLSATGSGITNDAALMRAGGELVLDTRGGTLANSQSGNANGLIANAGVTLRAGALNNAGGYVEAGTTLTVPADAGTTRIDNQQGTLYSRGSATLNTAALDNTGGRIEALGDVTVSATGAITNASTATQTSRLAAGGALNVTAASLDNSAAGATAPNAADVGLSGTHVTATLTGTLDNRGGFVRAADSVQASATLIDNRGGTVAAGDPAAPIQADGLRTRGTVTINGTATLNNGDAGLLYATRLLDVDVAALQGSGSLASLGDLRLNLRDVHDNSQALSAGRDATVTASGALTNRARIEAGGVLTLTAPDIVNAASGEIVATDTRVTASGNLTNHGLIDGTYVLVSAGNALTNHGRIYGDALALSAGTLDNRNAIAARWSLDIGAGKLVNDLGAELFSLGDLRIGSTLDANRRASGSATSVTNNGARIEALGNLRIDADSINNLNIGFSTQLQTVSTETVAINNVPGSATWLADSEVAFQDEPDNYGKRANFAALRRNDETYALTVYRGDPADKQVFGLGRRPPVYVPAHYVDNCMSSDNCSTPPSYIPDQYLLSANDPLWAAAQVPAPAAGATQEQINTAYATLQGMVDAFNAQWSRFDAWAHIAGTRTTQESVVTGGQAGQILAGGNITLSGAVDNRVSRIVAGGLLDISGAAVNNTGASGVRVEQTVGTSIYTRIDHDTFGDDDRVFDRRAYDSGELTTTLSNLGAVAPQSLGIGSNPEIDTTNQAGPKAGVNGPAASRTAARAVLDQGSGAVVQAVQAARGVVAAVTGQPVAPVGTPTARLTVPALQGTTRITTAQPSLALPTSSLFNVGNAPGRRYLVETDPRFTEYRTWASSDVLLAQLNAEPQTTLRRLGDGFYEQRLVTEQLMAATGQRYIGDYRDDQEQYLALLNAGAEFARAQQLTLGTALTETQMRQLTTDLVWLVAQEVRLPDGSTERVLVPQVYVRVAEGDLRTDGTLMAGSAVRLQLQGDLANSGTIAGRAVTDIQARNIGNTGRIASDDLTLLTAREDIRSSGAIDGQRVGLSAGRDVLIESTTASSQGPNANRTVLDRVATVNAGQLLQVSAGRDITLTGARLNSDGSLLLDAQRDLNLATVNVAESLNLTWDARNRLNTGSSAEIGSTVKAVGDITLAVGQDLNARAAYVATDRNGTGTISASAGRDIVITNGVATSASEEDRYIEDNRSGFGPSGSALNRRTSSSRSTTTHSASNIEQVQASTFSADAVTMSAGRDLTIKGSNVSASNDISLSAARDLTLTAAAQTSTNEQSKDEQRSGAGAMGGISNGKKRVEQANTSASTTQVASSVGSLQGNVTITAGNEYRQTASDVSAPGLRDKDGNLLQGGDIAISAANVTIDTADNTSTASQDLRMRQSGVSVTFSSPIVNALQGMVQTLDAAGQTKDERTQALAAASTVMAAANLASTITQASALNISVSVGNSRSQSHDEQSGSMAATSSVQAGGNLTITANGKEPGQGNITALGANLSAGNNATLSATNGIDLRAAQNSATQSSTNRSSSASVGIGINLGGAQNGITVNAAASQARGNANGTDTTNTLSTVSAGNTLTLNSGRDTNLIGAVASGNQVTANVGGNLDIRSVQDTSTHTSAQQSAGVGVSICVPPICYGASSVSVSLSQGRVNGEFASVATQSGIRAGDGGFNVNVGGNTNLTGAAITSSQAAVDAGRNSLSTATLTQSAIGNSSSADASQISLSASYSSEQTSRGANGETVTVRNADGSARQAGVNGVSASPPMVLSASDDASSTTRSAISAGTVTIRSGDTSALDGVSRTAVTGQDTSNAIKPVLNQAELQAQMQVAQSFIQQAGALIDNMGQQADRLRNQAEQAERAGNADEAQRLRTEAQGIEANWGPGGTYRQGLTALTAAAGGNVTGGVGQFAQAAVVNYVQQQGAEYIGRLMREGAVEEGSAAHAALHAIAGCAGAAGSGQSCSAGAMGGAASTVINTLMGDANNLTNAQRNARTNLVSTIVAGATVGTSPGNVAAATTAATVEMENNGISRSVFERASHAYNLCRQGGGNCQQQLDAVRQLFNADAQRTQALCGASGNLAACASRVATLREGLTSMQAANQRGSLDGHLFGSVMREGATELAWAEQQLARLTSASTNPVEQAVARGVESGVLLGNDGMGSSAGARSPTQTTQNTTGVRTGARPRAGEDAAPEGAAQTPRAAPVGDEPLPNVHDRHVQRQETPEEVWQQLNGRVDQTRRDIDNSVGTPKQPGNVGVAEIRIDGQPATTVQAHSQIGNNPASARDGFVGLPPEGQRILQPVQDPKDRVPREVDTEYKILENFAQQNRGNTQVGGRIDLFTERPPCRSCTNVIEQQFQELFPNMTVRVYHSDGQITTYQNGVPTTTRVPVNNPNNWPRVPTGGKPPG
jgi:filamentous hemagglutinin